MFVTSGLLPPFVCAGSLLRLPYARPGAVAWGSQGRRRGGCRGCDVHARGWAACSGHGAALYCHWRAEARTRGPGQGRRHDGLAAVSVGVFVCVRVYKWAQFAKMVAGKSTKVAVVRATQGPQGMRRPGTARGSYQPL
eukprot:351236-Chlamydomonas_euryale.AAC.5